jgi:hypothetical protein
MPRIILVNTAFEVHIGNVGRCFASAAHCTIEGHRFESDTLPFGASRDSLTQNLFAKVVRRFPTARLESDGQP